MIKHIHIQKMSHSSIPGVGREAAPRAPRFDYTHNLEWAFQWITACLEWGMAAFGRCERSELHSTMHRKP